MEFVKQNIIGLDLSEFSLFNTSDIPNRNNTKLNAATNKIGKARRSHSIYTFSAILIA
jgi:hypothetical protein